MYQRPYKNLEEYEKAVLTSSFPLVNVEEARKAAKTLHLFSVVDNMGRFWVSEYSFYTETDIKEECETWGWSNSRGAEETEMPIRVTGMNVPDDWMSSQRDADGNPLDWKGDRI